MLGLFCIIDKY